MKKKRFLTLSPALYNKELTKDGGMIPYMMYKFHDYDSTVACFKKGEYPALQNEVKGLKIIFLKKIFYNPYLDMCWFLLFNSRKYDVLHMFHRPSVICCLFFKIVKLGKGVTYIKLDSDNRIKENRNNIKVKVLEKLLSYVDIVSIETKELYRYLNEQAQIKVEYIPNGFYEFGNVNKTSFEEKENTILTVGRIGTEQKATEILMEGFKLFAENNKTWKLKIVGNVELGFHEYITDYFAKNPTLIDRVEFIGQINDKFKLTQIFKSAKIFVLTSRWESFGLVYVEAIHAGCYIISTDISPAYDVTDNWKFGKSFPIDDSLALAKAMEESTENENYLKQSCEKVQHFAYQNFYWPQIVNKLDTLIKEKKSLLQN